MIPVEIVVRPLTLTGVLLADATGQPGVDVVLLRIPRRSEQNDGDRLAGRPLARQFQDEQNRQRGLPRCRAAEYCQPVFRQAAECRGQVGEPVSRGVRLGPDVFPAISDRRVWGCALLVEKCALYVKDTQDSTCQNSGAGGCHRYDRCLRGGGGAGRCLMQARGGRGPDAGIASQLAA